MSVACFKPLRTCPSSQFSVTSLQIVFLLKRSAVAALKLDLIPASARPHHCQTGPGLVCGGDVAELVDAPDLKANKVNNISIKTLVKTTISTYI
jgi:hypothetical protein